MHFRWQFLIMLPQMWVKVMIQNLVAVLISLNLNYHAMSKVDLKKKSVKSIYPNTRFLQIKEK